MLLSEAQALTQTKDYTLERDLDNALDSRGRINDDGSGAVRPIRRRID